MSTRVSSAGKHTRAAEAPPCERDGAPTGAPPAAPPPCYPCEMPSPVAHIGAAFALTLALGRTEGRPSARVVVAAAFASIAPDLDIALAAVHPAGLAWHRGPSHSLVGAAAIGLACAAIARVRGVGAWAAVTLAAVLHVPFDWSTGEPGAPARYGVPWAWPVDPARAIAEDPWFGAFRIDEAGFLANMWAPHALPVYLREVGTAAALVAVAAGVRWARRRRARGATPA